MINSISLIISIVLSVLAFCFSRKFIFGEKL